MEESRGKSSELVSLGSWDVVVIGAGIVGAAVFRELTRYHLRVLLVDALNDVGGEASRATSAIIHAGFDPEPGTLMSQANVDGVQLWFRWSQELSIDLEWNGSLVVAFNDEEVNEITRLLHQGKNVGVPVKFLGREEVLRREPMLNPEIRAALYAPVSGIIDPFQAVVALVGNGLKNGGHVFLNARVKGLERRKDGVLVHTEKGSIQSKVVVNCAGVGAHKIMEMAGETWFTIHPRRGQYFVLDKQVGHLVRHVVFPAPTSLGKGTLVTRTTHGNLLIGPTAEDLAEPDSSTTAEGLRAVLEGAKRLVPFPFERYAITQYAGLRAMGSTGDFLVAHSKAMEGLVNVAGIKSPGFAAAPALARLAVKLVGDIVRLEERSDFDTRFEFPPRMTEIPFADREGLIFEDPKYGHIVCRCEMVSEGEIVSALRMNPPAMDLDGIKRRIRATSGRCQGGFCMPRIIDILVRELGISPNRITKFGGRSFVVYGDNRGDDQ
ncbi:NAD(P)/FAD-dependent oxidoreductase [Coprothermobacteraceae bacterium]|nr:NAD(P)/FAD-dependent oxidoreductase [Coprothermobacteraceae bacterium]